MRLHAKLAVIGALGIVLAAAPTRAHHSFAAEYDATRPILIDGTVTRIEWTNPHAHCYVEAADKPGAVAEWCIELAGPKALLGCGWRHDSMRVGDHVHIDGYRSKDGSTRVNARIVTLADGRTLSAGSSGGDVQPH